MTIDTNELRKDKRPQSSITVHALLDRLEAAESEALEQARLNGMGAEREAALLAKLEAAEKDIAVKEEVIDSLAAVVKRLDAQCDAAEKEHNTLRTTVRHEPDCVEAAKAEIKALRAKIEAAENDAAHQKALAASALRVAEGWERKCGELRAEVIYWKEQKEPGAAGWRALARILQAKIDAMEKQEPVAWLHETRRDSDVVTDAVKHVWGRVAVGSMAAYSIPLYTIPGAKGEEK